MRVKQIILVSVAVSMVIAAAAWAASTPAVVTGSATKVGNFSAQLHGTVNPEGASTDYNFEYGINTSYGSTSATGRAGGGTKAVTAQENLAGLNPGTVYHYRIAAASKLGTAFGADHAFKTTGNPLPAAITGTPLNVGKTTVTLTGAVVTQNQATGYFFEYGTSTIYGLQTNAGTATASATATPVTYELTGLSPGTTFHYRLVAAHTGTADEVGGDATFTTIPLAPRHVQVTAHTTPVHARHKPYLFTTTGAVTAPSLPVGVGCTGQVVVRFLRGHRSVAVRRSAVQTNCTFSAQVMFRHLIDHTKSQLTVTARFHGNAYMRAAAARSQRIRLG